MSKDTIIKIQRQPIDWEKILQYMYLTNNLSLEYVEYNSIIVVNVLVYRV